mgnify:CR=1 FL=1
MHGLVGLVTFGIFEPTGTAGTAPRLLGTCCSLALPPRLTAVAVDLAAPLAADAAAAVQAGDSAAASSVSDLLHDMHEWLSNETYLLQPAAATAAAQATELAEAAPLCLVAAAAGPAMAVQPLGLQQLQSLDLAAQAPLLQPQPQPQPERADAAIHWRVLDPLPRGVPASPCAAVANAGVTGGSGKLVSAVLDNSADGAKHQDDTCSTAGGVSGSPHLLGLGGDSTTTTDTRFISPGVSSWGCGCHGGFGSGAGGISPVPRAASCLPGAAQGPLLQSFEGNGHEGEPLRVKQVDSFGFRRIGTLGGGGGGGACSPTVCCGAGAGASAGALASGRCGVAQRPPQPATATATGAPAAAQLRQAVGVSRVLQLHPLPGSLCDIVGADAMQADAAGPLTGPLTGAAIVPSGRGTGDAGHHAFEEAAVTSAGDISGSWSAAARFGRPAAPPPLARARSILALATEAGAPGVCAVAGCSVSPAPTLAPLSTVASVDGHMGARAAATPFLTMAAPADLTEPMDVFLGVGGRMLGGGRLDLRVEAEEAVRLARRGGAGSAAAAAAGTALMPAQQRRQMEQRRQALLAHCVRRGWAAVAAVLLRLPLAADGSALRSATTGYCCCPASCQPGLAATPSAPRSNFDIGAAAVTAAPDLPEGLQAAYRTVEPAFAPEDDDGCDLLLAAEAKAIAQMMENVCGTPRAAAAAAVRASGGGARGAALQEAERAEPRPTLLHLAVASGSTEVVDMVVGAAAAAAARGDVGAAVALVGRGGWGTACLGLGRKREEGAAALQRAAAGSGGGGEKVVEQLEDPGVGAREDDYEQEDGYEEDQEEQGQEEEEEEEGVEEALTPLQLAELLPDGGVMAAHIRDRYPQPCGADCSDVGCGVEPMKCCGGGKCC